MKKSIKFGVILLTFYTANLVAKDKVDVCIAIHGLATTIMENRQQGVAMPIMMNIFEKHANSLPFLEKMVINAY